MVMLSFAFILLLEIFLVSAAPTVTINDGIVVGTSSAGLDSFKGIPYAQAPIGSRRLKPPIPLATGFGIITATDVPTACVPLAGAGPSTGVPVSVQSILAQALPGEADVAAQFGGPFGEDCLNLNVYRPSLIAPLTRLPVVAWIYGGGFMIGSTLQYDPTEIMNTAIALGSPFIFVAMNYRLAAFGFLGGKELSEDGSTNLGLRDQRRALQWIQDNVAAFGGDPSRVTIWGESAGSYSVADHLVIESGNNEYNGKPLFAAAIMDSGFTFPALNTTHQKSQSVYDGVVELTGCANTTDTLACLRTVDYSLFLDAQNNFTGAPYVAINLPYMPRPDPASSFFPVSPEVAFANANFARVPLIAGDQQDEGSFFAAALMGKNVTNQTAILTLMTTVAPEMTAEVSQQILATYPTDPAAGCPFGTGPLYEVYPGYKRIGALLGDIEFVLARRIFLDAVASLTKAWSYLMTSDNEIAVLGTTHSTDIFSIFYGASHGDTDVLSTRARYISFFSYHNPNIIQQAAPGFTAWPLYDTSSRQMLSINALGDTCIIDNFRQQSYLAIKQNYASCRI